ncbi:DNA polymerase III subunit beta [Streptomyces sp. NPDC053720]|uniref:DNA polymerase III subunit beta n=1 Tax=Streptomyces sp. NPDC053720 TaxID=3154855 RepID=UPI003413A0AC
MSQQVATSKGEGKKQEMPSAHFSGTHALITKAMGAAEFGVMAEGESPAQHGVLVETGGNKITLSTFDFETAVSVTVPAETPAAKKRSLLNFVEMKKTLAALVAGEPRAAAARTRLSLAGDLLSTEHLTVPVEALDLHEFAHPPEAVPAAVKVDAQLFLAQANRVLPAAGRDDTLPTLTGIGLTLDGQTLTMAATDCYRFAVADLPAPATLQSPTGPLTAIIPARTIARIAKQLKAHDGPVGIGISETDARVTFSTGTMTITSRPLDGHFPKHSSLFPTERDMVVAIDRDAAVRATKKCQALAKAKGQTLTPVSLEWDADAILTAAPLLADPADQARTKGMTIRSAIEHGVDTLRGNTLCLNPAFLLDALGTFTSDTITLHLRGVKGDQIAKPVLLTEGTETSGDGYRHLLMPVRTTDK